MSIEIKSGEWKKTNPDKTMTMILYLNENCLVSGINEVVEQINAPTSDPEDPLPVHVIPDEG